MDTSARTDCELITEILGGLDDSFTELVNRYKNLVYSVIYRLTKDKELANDYAQDVFLKVYKNLKSYSPEYKFSTWIMRITGNHIIDMHRKKKWQEVSFEEHAESIERSSKAEISAEGAFLKLEEARRIEKIVADLPEMYKVPVVLYHGQGLSYQEISESLGEPLSKVKNRIFRGRKMLRTKLAGEVSDGL